MWRRVNKLVNEPAFREAPLTVTGLEGDVSVTARLAGGGVTGQASALRHGIARALVDLDEGQRLTTNIVQADPYSLTYGIPVEIEAVVEADDAA